MRAILATRMTKTAFDVGQWKHGKMPRTAFPLSKNTSYTLGSDWNWCIHRLSTGERRFRLLVAFHAGKEQYRSWLGLEVGNDLAILARLEFQPDDAHRWHCHLKRCGLNEISVGVVKQPRTSERAHFCRLSGAFNVSELNAIAIAYRVFNVQGPQIDGELF